MTPENSEFLPNYLKKEICNCSYCKKHRLQYEQDQYFYEASDVAGLLRELPHKKARAGFAQKMSALFALELENETVQRNKSWLQKRKNLTLPGLRSDISKELL